MNYLGRWHTLIRWVMVSTLSLVGYVWIWLELVDVELDVKRTIFPIIILARESVVSEWRYCFFLHLRSRSDVLSR